MMCDSILKYFDILGDLKLNLVICNNGNESSSLSDSRGSQPSNKSKRVGGMCLGGKGSHCGCAEGKMLICVESG